MNILFILPSYYPEIGGVQRQADLLAHELVRRGHRVTILSRRVPGDPSEEQDRGVRIRRFFPANIPQRLYSSTMVLSATLFLLREGRRYDVIHCFRLSVHNLAMAVLRPLFGWRWLAGMSGSGRAGDLAPVPPGLRRALLRSALNRADLLLALSNEMRGEMIAFGLDQDRIRIVPNAVDVAHFAHPGRDYRRTDRLLYVGRLAPEKNLDGLLNALSRLPQPEMTLSIVGDGPLRTPLEALADDLGLTQRVTFHGATDDPAAFYRSHDVFVLPSHSEGLSTALLEAMASGMPCVCTPVGGAAEIIRHGANGILAEDTTAEAIARGLVTVCRASSEKRAAWGRAAASLVREHCSVEHVAAILEELYSCNANPPEPDQSV